MQAINHPTIALIVAAGSSSRYGGDVPKPYVNLLDRAVLSHVLDIFTHHPGVDGVRVVINRAHHPLYKAAAKDFQLMPPVVGGQTRQDSVRYGLQAIARFNPGKVLIHDAARPLVDAALIDRVLAGLDKAAAVLPAVAVTDSVHIITPPPGPSASRGGSQLTPLDRDRLVAAQTPQGFDFDKIIAAHQQFKDQAVTDDIALAALAGLEVTRVEGNPRNIKLTTPEQLVYAERMRERGAMIKRSESGDEPALSASDQRVASCASQQASTEARIRVGSGFDVHAFEDHAVGVAENEKRMVLCGIRVPHARKLKGHSDADVALHALTDAILGALAEGDIGEHFPPSDVRWKQADSKLFLAHAKDLLDKRGGVLNHIDVTIMGEAPKIAPHRTAMRQQLASLLGLDIRHVSVKATTTEKLGFLGRREGLAAQAMATVSIPMEG